MANPQKENGYTAIANEIMEALCRYRIPGEARQVLDCVLRLTYGFTDRKEVELSYTDIAKMTGLSRRNVVRAVAYLVSKATLSVRNDTTSKTSGANTLKFNKNYEEWGVVSKQTPSVRTDTRSSVRTDTSKPFLPSSKNNKTKCAKNSDSGKTDEIYDFYLTEIQPERRSGNRARINITSQLKHHSPEDLKQSVLNYKLAAMKSEPQYRKDPANFFGKNEPYFKDYLPSKFVVLQPTAPKIKTAAEIEKEIYG